MAGNEILLFELYKIYRDIKKTPESFDDFYFWGDMLLNDFDDVDKYMADATMLFRNVQDIKDIDQKFGGLADEQIEIVKRFWINFDPERPTGEKTDFISIWSILTALYTGFRKGLKDRGLAYEGMIFRELAESSEHDIFPGEKWDMLHFIGFNALNECEKTVMLKFRKAGKARFYWDYDISFIREGKLNSAGFFMRDNLTRFGNDMPADWNYTTMLSVAGSDVSRRVIETSSDVAQVKLIPGLVKELPDLLPQNAHHTAVILADENLLLPLLSSLPEHAGDINITMGYPLRQTMVYTLVHHLIELQKNSVVTGGVVRFNYKDVISILKHDLVIMIMKEEDSDILDRIISLNLLWVPSDMFAGSVQLKAIFNRPSNPAQLAEYIKYILSVIASDNESTEETTGSSLMRRNILNEFIYRVVLSVNRLETIIRAGDVVFTNDTYARILDRLLRMQSVPFSGEPLSGIQIMGILETRALDFKNLIILSVNEGIMPAISSGSSFIPFSLREAFGLPSLNHQESIYAYHFYRLLERAENVTFIYNSNSEGLKSGEMSRFLLQMKYENGIKPDFLNLGFEIRTNNTLSEKLARTGEHTKQLRKQFTGKKQHSLSPSAINTWLNCRMKFYYRYINRLKEADKISADVDPAILGNILHETMKIIYKDYRSQLITSEILDSLLKSGLMLEDIIEKAIKERFRKMTDEITTGNEIIIRDVLLTYIKKILKADKQNVPITILDLENFYGFDIAVNRENEILNIKAGGIIDRIDEVGGITRIVDYKTGTVADSVNSIADLFSDNRKKEYDGWLQTLLYCEAWLSVHPDHPVRPSIYKIRKISDESVDDRLLIKTGRQDIAIINDYNEVRDEFLRELRKIILVIFDEAEPFSMTTDNRGKCTFCEYKRLCMR